MSQTQSHFEEIEAAMQAGGTAAALTALIDKLRAERRPHELFDALSMQARHKLGLPLVMRQDLESVPEPQRSQLEESSLAVCREVGRMLLEEGKFREAWMYLRPTGETAAIRQAMESQEPNEELIDELIDVALNEAVHPGFGYQLVLDHYGTCNAITSFESSMYGKRKEDQQLVAGLLIEHLHAELLENLKSDVEAREGRPPTEDRIEAIVSSRGDLFQQFGSHIDVSHLQSTVRFARIVENKRQLALAFDLTEYGRRLHEDLQQPGEEPFVEFFAAHGLFFAAQLGEHVDRAIAHFRDRAENVDAHTQGCTSIEVYLALLARLGRHEEALQAAAELVKPGMQFSGFAPSMFELAEACNRFDIFSQLCRDRDDVVGFATGVMSRG